MIELRGVDVAIAGRTLLESLDALYSYVYDVGPSTPSPMRDAARLRVEAMDLSDAWVAAGCDLADPLLAQERRALVASYTALRDAVERSAHDRRREVVGPPVGVRVD